MYAKNKGNWKVQSIHFINKCFNLNSKVLSNYSYIKEVKQNSSNKFFLLLESKKILTINKTIDKNRIITSSLSQCNFFCTGDLYIKNFNKSVKKDKLKNSNFIKGFKKRILDIIYGIFSYEPYLYNEFPFTTIITSSQLVPRKFKEILSDSIKMNYIKKVVECLDKQKQDLENNKKQIQFFIQVIYTKLKMPDLKVNRIQQSKI